MVRTGAEGVFVWTESTVAKTNVLSKAPIVFAPHEVK